MIKTTLFATIIMVGLAGAAAVAHAQASPPQWTTLRTVCQAGSEDATRCAATLSGKYSDRSACVAANQGRDMVVKTLPGGKKYTSRCEAAMHGPLVAVSPWSQEKPVPGAQKWAIFANSCVKISATAGQCAIGMAGPFVSMAQCMQANRGKDGFQVTLPDGRQYGQTCQPLLEGRVY